jgi:hypothetical protein
MSQFEGGVGNESLFKVKVSVNPYSHCGRSFTFWDQYRGLSAELQVVLCLPAFPYRYRSAGTPYLPAEAK